jgi:acetyl esterase/lipase
MSRLFLLAILSALLQSPGRVRADDKAAKQYEVETHLDIAYRAGKDADPVKHKLDIYTPKGQKDFPVMMFVHGGSWKSGNKTMYAAVGSTFAKNGIGTVVINYRLTSSTNNIKHPDHVKDVAAAFAWVHANIGKYGGRKDRIFISGHSAGGHLVSLLATDEQYLKEHKLSFSDIRGVMPISGAYEIIPKFPYYDGPFGTGDEGRKDASPISHVKANHPPFLICYGDKDFLTIDSMSENFCKKLTGCKCEASTLKIDSRSHFSIIIQLAVDSNDPCTRAMLDFIAKHSEWKRPG